MLFVAYIVRYITNRSRDLLNDHTNKYSISKLCLALLLATALSACGVPSAGCGDGVVCIEDPASQNIATDEDIYKGKFAYNPSGDLLEGTLIPGKASPSGKIRDFGATQISILTETKTETQTGYRIFPVASDSELRKASKLDLPVDYPNDCGLSGSVTDRIKSCLISYPEKASWNGSTRGLYAESIWSLVSRKFSSGLIIWRDESTGHLWTSEIGSNVSYCEAAGVTNENYSSNCESNETPKLSYCASGNSMNLVGGGTNQAGLSSGSGNVTWRLPTRADFMKADLDGLRYVHNLSGFADDLFWTSNSWNEAASFLWIFSGEGDFRRLQWGSTEMNNSSIDVMCVGTEFENGN